MPKISALTTGTMPGGTESVPVVQNSTTKKLLVSDIAGFGYSTMSDLRAVSPVNGKTARTKAYATAGDDGGGTWRGVTGASVATYTHNGGTVIAPSGGDGSAAWLRDFDGAFVHVAWFGAITGLAADCTTAIQAALNTGIRVYAPGQYMTSAGLDAVAGGGLFGDGPDSVIKLVGATTDHVLEGSTIDGFYLSDITLDGDSTTKASASMGLRLAVCSNWEIPRLWVRDAKTWGIGFFGGSTDNRLGDIDVSDCGSSAIIVSSSNDNEITRLSCRDCGAFGLHLTESSDNRIGAIVAIDTTLEALGINYASLRNTVGTVVGRNNGDNCVSITGNYNNVASIFADSPGLNGLAFYGSRNSVGSLLARNVGQAGGTIAVIRCAPQFGGQASYNVVGSVQAIDDQTVATTANVIRAISDGHTAWTTATVVAAFSFYKNAGNVYRTAAGGTTGASAPVHTSGTVSDGGVSWTYVAAASNAVGNVVQSCTTTSNIDDPVYTGMPAGNWLQIGPGAIYSDYVWAADAAIRRTAVVWESGQTIVWGDVRSNGGRIYTCSNVGGTTANAPVHSSGTTALGDTIEWTFREGGANFSLFGLAATGSVAHSVFKIRSADNPATTRAIYCGSGSPASVVTGSSGDMYLRNDAIPGDEIFFKRSGENTTSGWSPVLFRRSGSTGSRPTVGATEIGFLWFDTSLGIPIWWNGSNWVNASGATV